MTETSHERLRAILDEMPNLVLLIDRQTGLIEEVGHRGASTLGYQVSDVRNAHARDLVHPDDHWRLDVAIGPTIAGEEERFEVRILDARGGSQLYLLSQRMLDERRVLVSAMESAAVTDSDSRFSDLMTLADLSDDIFMVTTRDGIVNYINGAATSIHGDRQYLGVHVEEFVDPESWQVISERIRAGEQRLKVRILGTHLDGTITPMELRSRFDEETQQWYTVQRNISALVEGEQRMERLNERLRRQATTDSLTGVANRAAFAEAVEQAIFFSDPFSLLLLDMDDFKSVNDTLGHAVGDDFLRVLARRLQATVALQDLVARLGGDEFVVFVPELDATDAAALATRILDAISAPFRIGEHSLSRSCSIGGATWAEGDSFSDVLRKADQAAYKAKHAGRSRFAMHEGPANGTPTQVQSGATAPMTRTSLAEEHSSS